MFFKNLNYLQFLRVMMVLSSQLPFIAQNKSTVTKLIENGKLFLALGC
jgi:hypothetical protein